MAIVPTGAIYKSLVFDGESSRDYGIYITGQAVYNAPERDVEMINIPGRNGSFALDKGRFQNIEVTYPAGIFADNEADFAQGISDFRNFLCSRNGYVRLTDDYNPDEYRMAVYKSGLDVSPAQLKAGEFQLVFDCKPQRYLTSGEEPITIGEWHETETASGSIASFEAEAGDAVKGLVVDIEPMQSGSGTPSPTNVRPISGYDSVVVNRSGKNLWSFASSGSKTSEGFIFPNASMPLVLPQGAYKFSAKASITNAIQLTFRNATDDVVATRIFTYTDVVDGKISYDFAFAESAYKASIYTNASASLTEIQLELGSTATAYEPYQGNTYTTDLSGTRYGGTLDVANGVLTVTDGNIASYNGETLPSTWISDRDVYASGTTPTTGAQVVYKLATPQTVQLTAQEVELLVGLNQVWANSGDVSVEYGTAPNVLINPTLFESSPMLMINGSGEVTINDYEPVRIMGGELGPYIAASGKTTSQTLTETFDFDDSLLNTGDSIGPLTGEIRAQYYPWRNGTEDFETSQSGDAGTIICKKYNWYSQRSYSGCYVKCELNTSPFTYGTSRTDTTSFSGTVPTSTEGNLAISAVCTVTYDGAKTITMSLSVTRGEPTKLLHFASGDYVKREALYANSSQSILGNPLYIDLDIGEAYKIENGKAISINEGVIIPASLPKLSSGANTITTENIAELQVVPRWWKI